MVPSGGGLLQPLEAPPGLPHWLSESDIDVYAGEFRRTGFAGGLNGYRNIDRNWELPVFCGVAEPRLGAAVTRHYAHRRSPRTRRDRRATVD